MPVALITPESMRDKPTKYVDMLREADFEVRYPNNPELARGLCSEQETIDELRGVSAVIAGGECFSGPVLAASSDLRVVARAGVGFDRVDISAATERKIAVTITPTANHEAVAEHALALLFGVAKSIATNDRKLRNGQWPRMICQPVRGKTLGIFGLGRIGRSMALRGAALGMPVLATEKYPDETFVRDNGIELVDFDTLLARCDFVSIHCPLNEETQGTFNREAFEKMKPGSVLINTSRGPLVVEADIYDALRSGHLGGAGLDVFEQEPTATDNPLFELDNVVLSPHLAGIDEQSLENMGIESARNIITLRQDQWPEGAVVNHELSAGWKW